MKIPNSIVSNDVQSEVLVYEPPKIEVEEITVEKGFANSSQEWGDETW